MGCWNGTCMVSNLPILAGEKVKLVFLHRPYGNVNILNKSSFCYTNGIFHVGAFPLNAEYDDYGSVENIEEDVNYKLVETYFKKKYPKIKVEDEEISDDDYTLYKIIEGIERGSLEVFTEGDVERKEMAIKTIEVYSKSGFSSEHIKKEWEELANMDVSLKWRQDHKLNFVMIRADVWNEIVKNHKTEFWKEEKYRTHPKDYYQTAQEWMDKKFTEYKQDEYGFSNPFNMTEYAGGNIMFMSDFYSIAIKNKNEETLYYFQKLFTELTIVESFLSATRKSWMITSGAGSQSEEWNAYILLNNIVTNICNQKINDTIDDE